METHFPCYHGNLDGFQLGPVCQVDPVSYSIVISHVSEDDVMFMEQSSYLMYFQFFLLLYSPEDS